MLSSVSASRLPTDVVAAFVVKSFFIRGQNSHFLFAAKTGRSLTDTRRTKCFEWCTSNAAPTESEEIQQLDIITSGHKPRELATRNLGQQPSPSGRTDEKLGDLQFTIAAKR